MNAADVLKYGHLTVLNAVDGLPASEWETPGVCGGWSMKQIIAHLASFEQMLAELLTTFLGGGPTPTLSRFIEMDGDEWNAAEVGRRQGQTLDESLAEYNGWQAQVMSLITQIPPERLRQTGTLPWYGMEYDLEDFLVYTYYGHKREHSAHIGCFRDQPRPDEVDRSQTTPASA